MLCPAQQFSSQGPCVPHCAKFLLILETPPRAFAWQVTGLGIGLPGFKIRLCLLVSVQPWARYSACLSLSVHTCEMGVITAYLISCSGIKAILHKHLVCTQVTVTATTTMTSSFGAVAQTILLRSFQRVPLVCPHPLSDVPH